MDDLNYFLKLQNLIKEKFSSFRSYGDCMFSVNEDKDTPSIDVWFSCMIHGDEIQGLSIINSFMEKLLENETRHRSSFAISVGNPRATMSNQRFTERDLNRCFGLPMSSEYEIKRAHDLLKLAVKTTVLIDFHQTVEPSESAFFILPDQTQNVQFAFMANKYLESHKVINSQLPIISYPENNFGPAGKTLMDIMPSGAAVMSIELGQKGKSEGMRTLGLKLIEFAFHFSTITKQQNASQQEEGLEPMNQDVYQITSSIKTEPGLALIPDLKNLMNKKAGDVIARLEFAKGDQVEIRLKENCKILFPKYGHMAKKSPELLKIATIKPS